jgi:hypothetical protein
MRRVIFIAALLVASCAKERRDVTEGQAEQPQTPPAAPIATDPPPLHAEKGLRNRIAINEAVTLMPLRDRNGNILNHRIPADREVPIILGRYDTHRLLIGDVMHGSQARKLDNHILDDFQLLTAANPWDNLAVLGALRTFDVRQEPLTYHHWTGPVGAVYRELRTRKNGADAKAPVAVLGLTAGTQACYALPGQKMIFYEADPVVARLVADTDKYFSYVSDARKRGAEIEIRLGDRRAKLKEDKDRKYALILVDVAESHPLPTDIFTKEAVQEYFDRLTDDGLLMLHISHKELRLEPMIAAIARELNLAARMWHDNVEIPSRKLPSSWVALGRTEKPLGTFALPTDQQLKECGTRFRPLEPHPNVPAWTDKNATIVEAMKFKR